MTRGDANVVPCIFIALSGMVCFGLFLWASASFGGVKYGVFEGLLVFDADQPLDLTGL